MILNKKIASNLLFILIFYPAAFQQLAQDSVSPSPPFATRFITTVTNVTTKNTAAA